MDVINQLDPELQISLESHFRALLRAAKNIPSLKIDTLIDELRAIISTQAEHGTHLAFRNLKEYYLSPVLPEETVNSQQSLLQRKMLIKALIEKEIVNLSESSELNPTWRKSRIQSGTWTSFFINQKQIFWISLEYPAEKFIQALLAKDEKSAYKLLFTPKITNDKDTDISLDTKCYLTLKEAARRASPNNKDYFQRLYNLSLVPIYIQLEGEISDATQADNFNISLKEFKLKTLTVSSCIVGTQNANKEAIVIKATNTPFDQLLADVLTREVEYDKNKKIIDIANASYDLRTDAQKPKEQLVSQTNLVQTSDKNNSESSQAVDEGKESKSCCRIS